MLMSEEGMIATSCATGPAFEGAAIDHGMHAISGAIDSVKIIKAAEKPQYSVLQKDRAHPKMASGICGTGVISGVAELLKAGILSPDGRFNRKTGSAYLIHGENDMPEFVLAEPEETQTGRNITLTQKDIRAVQLAKGALYAGIKLLCREAGIERPERILVAGAFGNFIDKKDALTIGMFPDMQEADVTMVGNAAGAGAVLSLLDAEVENAAKKLAAGTRVLDLASLETFQDTFVSSLYFPER
jgi:uncharacterized 2Fe-2S/4Fe-4S cluster protein (DUF4445 family)